MTTIGNTENLEPVATTTESMPPQPQDDLRLFLKHLYIQCFNRYAKFTLNDGNITSILTDQDRDYDESDLEGNIDMQYVDQTAATNNELHATIFSTPLAAGVNNHTDVFCPWDFDGYRCWPPTPAGTVLSQHCPDFIEGFNSKFLAYKTCLANGSWFRHPENNRTWSNYTTCVDHEDYEFRKFVNQLYVKGYALSLLALLISIIIFLGFKSLRCTRIRIHVHLFASLACSCIAWILWYVFVVEQPDLVAENPPWCIALHLVILYFMLVNYFWMFCEGLHLHLVLVVVFVKDTIVMRWFKLLSWLSPILFVCVYGLARYFSGIDNKHCWMDESLFLWIFSVPITLSLLASFIFLINVLRVIVHKLHPQSAQPAPLAIRKAVRATIILVPLFGLQHFLLPYRPDAGADLDQFYQLLSVVLVSLQGFVVSFLFCFANHDVIFAIRTLLNKLLPSLVSPPPVGSNTGQLATTTPSRELGV
ncbi:uncharacterized protein Dwil_GK25280 [Drosophila willistoni]|uniref:Calcitonin gene-related peptide type 1 receptor n=1 Tax=Drosophila willistoni TaxID=7260 RepID=B4NEI4_DROWI|nr:calcitonin gene-related peptide type 1 receptor isoform X1 [Drosophila willistoni]XP_046867206.1 calcitonin gene-related peptide type 1 receptor isoform X1 [Drosophila willistoni]EDW82153.1 uncharacterized protein Dwil_GK25280 [Drosophila willistoni]